MRFVPGRLLVVVFLMSLGGFLLATLFDDDRQAQAQQEQVEGALLLIMDASGSMNRKDEDGTRLIDGAKQALNGVVDALPEGTPVGLRVYGHRVPNTDRERGCRDTELIQPIEPLDRAQMKQTIAGFEAKGFTPIGLSLREAAEDLPPEGPRTIVLVSDGEDTCAPPPPCQVARDLVAQGIDVKVETVGFFIRDNPKAQNQLQCIADATGGTYRSADSAAELVEELETVSTRAARAFEAEGQQVTDAPAPFDAETIEPGVRYTDTVLGEEINYYRFEVEQGQTIDVQAVREANPNGEGAVFFDFEIVDANDNRIGGADYAPGEDESKPQIRGVDDVLVEDDVDELFLKISTDPVTGNSNPDLEYDIEFVVNVTGGEETTSEPIVEETEPGEDTEAEETMELPETTAAEDQAPGEPDEPEEPPVRQEQASEEGGNLLTTVLVFVSGMLAMLVVGLAIALFVVLRRRGVS